MRVVFSCNSEAGHVHPALPLARAARDRGHEVVFLSGPDVREIVEAHGFELLCCGPDFASLVADALTRYPDTPLESAADQQRFGFGRLFSTVRVGATVDDAAAHMRAFRPDVIVNEPAEFVGPLVAAQLGLPNATLGVSLVVADEWLQLAADSVAKYWTDAGLEPRTDAGVYRTLYLNQWPRSLQRPLPEHMCDVRDLRPDVFGADATLPPALESLGTDRPLIYVTFGTMFGDATTLRVIVEGLVDLDVDVVVTVGHQIEPNDVDLGRANLVVRNFVPQGALLSRCHLAVNHGGSGSVLGPLHYGVPLVIVPLGADQLENAQQLASADVARVLRPGDLRASAIAQTVTAVLADEDLHRTATAVRDEIASMSPPSDVITTLEELVT